MRKLHEYVYSQIHDTDRVVLKTPYGRVLAVGHWFNDGVLDYMNCNVKSVLRTSENRVHVFLTSKSAKECVIDMYGDHIWRTMYAKLG